MRSIVSNLILNLVTKSGIDELDPHHNFEYFRLERRVCAQHGPSLINEIFVILNYEATVNVRDVKLFARMLSMCSENFQEGITHDDCIDDVLASLMIVDSTKFKLEIMLMKSKRVRRKPAEVREIIKYSCC